MPKRLLIAVLAVLLGLGLAAAAQAELSQEGTLRISFGGGFVPRALPRDHPAPVTVHLRGAISTTDGSHPPALQRVEVALNRNGRIATAGLPVCTAPLLQSTGTEAALAGCRPALVGRGRFRASLQFPNAPEVPATGPMLAFNGRYRGKSALFLHLYASTPVRFTFVVPLTVSRRHDGRFGAVLAGRIPTLAGGLGSVTEIDLRLGREYGFRGVRRSYLSASCAAPAGFPGAIFSLARGSFYFAGGTRIDTTLARDCKVR